MKDEPLLPDDPRLTAYALGELTGDDRAAVEAALRDDPALRAVVEEIRATTAQLEAALANEPIMGSERAPPTRASRLKSGGQALRKVLRFEPKAAAAPETTPSRGPSERAPGSREGHRRDRRRKKLLRFPESYFLIAGLAAACFAIFVVLRRGDYEARQLQQQAMRTALAAKSRPEQRTYLAVNLGEAPAAGASSAPPEAIAAEIPAAPPVSTESLTPPQRPVFIDRGLTLIEQTRPAPATNQPVRPADSTLGVGTGERASLADASAPAGAQTPMPLANFIRPDPVTIVAANGIGIEEEPISSPPVSTPLVASVTRGKAPTAPTTAARRSLLNSGTDDEIVRLDTVTVSADPLKDFLTLREIHRASSTTRGMAERRELPRAPAAAEFTRATETYAFTADNDFTRALTHRRSSFIANVDTASYANVRRIIEHGALPTPAAVRIEEMLNYFSYGYAAPAATRGEAPPFAASLEVASAPWAPTHRLVRIGLKSREVTTTERPRANLVFLIDVSASMSDANKLPLVKESMRLLLAKLRPDDQVAIVVYAGDSGLALPSTPVAKSRAIVEALEALKPGGSTNGSLGIQLAYDIAKANFVPQGINRVILCTDGDFNVGMTSDGDLVSLLEEKAKSGVYLTVLGFGMGNYKDATLEKLASRGGGTYGYIDTRREAEKLLGEQVNTTLTTVAKDVKINVAFNPAKVSRYRLIGYENRQLRKEDFNHEKYDAGEIGAGHAVTALYEVIPVGVDDVVQERADFVDVKYQANGAVSSRLETPIGPPEPPSRELLTVNVHYKKPDGIMPRTMDFELMDGGAQFAQASADFRFAAAVAQFGMILRDSPHRGESTLGDVVAWAAGAATTAASDPGGYRGDFIDLVRKTQKLLR